MFNHSVDDCGDLIKLLSKPLKEDFFTLSIFEGALKNIVKPEYIWQFPEGGWVSVTPNRTASISSVNDDDLQLSLAAMSAVSEIDTLFVPTEYEEACKNFYEKRIKSIHRRILFSRKKTDILFDIEREDAHIVKATAEDVQRLITWYQKVMEESGDTIAADSYEKMLDRVKKDVAYGYVYMITNNVQPIGYIMLKPCGEGALKRLHIHNVFIDAPYRRFGLGSFVVEHFCQKYFSEKGKHVMLMVAAQSLHAQQMYKKLGFKPVGEFSVVYL